MIKVAHIMLITHYIYTLNAYDENQKLNRLDLERPVILYHTITLHD